MYQLYYWSTSVVGVQVLLVGTKVCEVGVYVVLSSLEEAV